MNSAVTILFFSAFFALVIVALKGIFHLIHKRVYRHTETYTPEGYAAVESLFWVICQQAVIFTLFRWDIACMLWMLSFFANGWVMRRPRIYTALFARSYQRMQKRFEKTPKADAYSSDPKFCREFQPVLRDDLIVQSRPLVGLIMTSRTYEYKWYKVHLNCLMFAVLGPLFSAIMPFLDVARPEGGTAAGYIYDAVTFLGTLCILYSIGYFCDAGAHFRVKGWIKPYNILFFIGSMFLLALFIAIECGVFAQAR